MTQNTDPDEDTDTSATRTNTDRDVAPDTFADLREQFDDECVLHTLSKAYDIDCENPPAVYFLEEDTGRVYRVLEATRGSPDSGWFVLALAGPHADDSYERQLRVHDSDTHRVLLGNEIEHYDHDEPTPADDVVTTGEGSFIIRMDEPPIPIAGHSQEDDAMGEYGHSDTGTGRKDEIDEFDPRTETYHCEACGTEQTHNEYVSVGPSTPAAQHLGLEAPDGDRDHFVVCDPCFEEAATEIAGKYDGP